LLVEVQTLNSYLLLLFLRFFVIIFSSYHRAADLDRHRTVLVQFCLGLENQSFVYRGFIPRMKNRAAFIDALEARRSKRFHIDQTWLLDFSIFKDALKLYVRVCVLTHRGLQEFCV
jgi:hypothetical protein